MVKLLQQTADWYIKWSACCITLAGAMSTAIGLDPINVYLLNAGAAVYLWWSWRIREWSLITINASLLLIYIYGTLTRLTSI